MPTYPSKHNNFTFDDQFYGNVNVYAILPHRKERDFALYLLALLNSTAMEFCLKQISTFVSGMYYLYKHKYLEPLPIKIPKTPKERRQANQMISKVKKILKLSSPQHFLENLPLMYLNEYRSKGVEFDEREHSFNADHSELNPFLSGVPGKGYVVYPDKGEDSIWVDTREKALYLILILRNRKVKQNETVKILIPRDNSIVTEILERLKKTVHEVRATPIDQLEEEINELVYQLYGLNEDDKAIIENFLKKF